MIVRTVPERIDIYNLFEELRSDYLRTRSAPSNAMVLHRVEPDPNSTSVSGWWSGDRVPITFTWLYGSTVRGSREEVEVLPVPEAPQVWSRRFSPVLLQSFLQLLTVGDMNVYSRLRSFQSGLLRQLTLLLYH